MAFAALAMIAGGVMAGPLPQSGGADISPATETPAFFHGVQYSGTITDVVTGSELRLPEYPRLALHEKSDRGQEWKARNISVNTLRYLEPERTIAGLYERLSSIDGRAINQRESELLDDRFTLVGLTPRDGSWFTVVMFRSGNELRGLSIYLTLGRVGSSRERSRLMDAAREIRASFVPFPGVTTPPSPAPPDNPAPPQSLQAQPPQEQPLARQNQPAQPYQSQDGAFTIYPETDLDGVETMRSRPDRPMSQSRCEQICRESATCMAFTRYTNGVCVIRGARGGQTPAPGTISAVKAETAR